MKRQTKNINTLESEKEKIKAQKKEKKKYIKNTELSTMDLIPIKSAVDNGESGFEYVNGLGFFNLFQILSWDYISSTEQELVEHIYSWDKLYRTNEKDLKLISVNLPIDLHENIYFYSDKFNKTTNPLYREGIRDSIEEFKKMKYREMNEFYLYCYGKTYDDLMKLNAKVRTGLMQAGLVQEVSKQHKLSVLAKYSNPYNNPINKFDLSY